MPLAAPYGKHGSDECDLSFEPRRHKSPWFFIIYYLLGDAPTRVSLHWI